MRSFAHYISKHLVSFAAFILILLFLNAVVFGLTFQKIVTEDYGDSSPQSMLETTAAAATPEQLSVEAVQKLRQNDIWAIYLNADGQCYWSVDLPESYNIQDVALFSKGYIEDYPVFVWNTDDGLLVLGYKENEHLIASNDWLKEENVALREQNKDYALLRKVFGSRKIDDLVTQAREAQQAKRRQRQRSYDYER